MRQHFQIISSAISWLLFIVIASSEGAVVINSLYVVLSEPPGVLVLYLNISHYILLPVYCLKCPHCKEKA